MGIISIKSIDRYLRSKRISGKEPVGPSLLIELMMGFADDQLRQERAKYRPVNVYDKMRSSYYKLKRREILENNWASFRQSAGLKYEPMSEKAYEFMEQAMTDYAELLLTNQSNVTRVNTDNLNVNP